MISNVQLTTKERYLLEDQKSHEEICIQKYNKYANMASDQELKNIFQSHAQKEQEHYNTINQILNGQVPSMGGGQQSGQSQGQQSQGQQSQGQQSQGMQNQQSQGMQGQQSQGMQQSQSSQGQQMSGSSQSSSSGFLNSDKDLCTDILMTEKYVSATYNTAIFEFKDTQIRDVLNHIQKEEQKHGEAVFHYMQNKGMYQAQ